MEDMNEVMRSLAPIATQQATLGVTLGHMQRQLDDLSSDIGAINKALDDRDKQVSDERKATRTALYSLVGVLMAALISGGAAIVVALVGGG